MKHRTLDDKELATVLAALRLWQSKQGPDNLPAQANVVADFGPYFEECEPLSREEIDALCERINT
jgi:hypothetical protein